MMHGQKNIRIAPSSVSNFAEIKKKIWTQFTTCLSSWVSFKSFKYLWST